MPKVADEASIAEVFKKMLVLSCERYGIKISVNCTPPNFVVTIANGNRVQMGTRDILWCRDAGLDAEDVMIDLLQHMTDSVREMDAMADA